MLIFDTAAAFDIAADADALMAFARGVSAD